MARVLTPEDVLRARFTQTQFRDGYDEREVDELLDGVVVALRFHAEGRPATAAPLTADQVELVRLTPTRLRRGYDQAEVDAFLADVAHTLRGLESGRVVATGAGTPTVRGAGSVVETPSVGSRLLRFLRGDRG